MKRKTSFSLNSSCKTDSKKRTNTRPLAADQYLTQTIHREESNAGRKHLNDIIAAQKNGSISSKTAEERAKSFRDSNNISKKEQSNSSKRHLNTIISFQKQGFITAKTAEEMATGAEVKDSSNAWTKRHSEKRKDSTFASL